MTSIGLRTKSVLNLSFSMLCLSKNAPWSLQPDDISLELQIACDAWGKPLGHTNHTCQ